MVAKPHKQHIFNNKEGWEINMTPISIFKPALITIRRLFQWFFRLMMFWKLQLKKVQLISTKQALLKTSRKLYWAELQAETSITRVTKQTTNLNSWMPIMLLLLDDHLLRATWLARDIITIWILEKTLTSTALTPRKGTLRGLTIIWVPSTRNEVMRVQLVNSQRWRDGVPKEMWAMNPFMECPIFI